MEGHQENLNKLCRVCSNRVQKFKQRNVRKPVKKCALYAEKIKLKYNIDVSFDEPHRHPLHICHLCYSNLFVATSREIPNDWSAHPERGTCSVCSKVEEDKGGRPKKGKSAWVDRLVQKELDNKAEVTSRFEMLSRATTPFLNTNFTCEDSSFVCKLCNTLISRPVETPCEHIFCLSCLENEFVQTSSSSVICKICKHNFNLMDLNPPRQYFMDVLKTTRVKCTTCKQSSWHDCSKPESSIPVDEKVYKAILDSNVAPLGKIGQQLTSHLLNKCMDDTTGTTVRLATKGTVSNFPLLEFHMCCAMDSQY